jgi:hypothetical protein
MIQVLDLSTTLETKTTNIKITHKIETINKSILITSRPIIQINLAAHSLL